MWSLWGGGRGGGRWAFWVLVGLCEEEEDRECVEGEEGIW